MLKKLNLVMKVQAEEKSKKVVKNKKEYTNIIEEKELEIAEGVKLVFSVAQAKESSSCHVDIRTWIEGENYTGPTKKGINFDIENLEEIQEILKAISKECEKVGK